MVKAFVSKAGLWYGLPQGQAGKRETSMFKVDRRDTALTRAFTLAELVYHGTVRNIRKGHSTGLQALIMNLMQSVIFIAAFVIMFTFLGLRGAAIRGDFVLYIMSGIFLFMTHIKAMGAIVGAEGPASPMMKHAPMNTAIAIFSAALLSLGLIAIEITGSGNTIGSSVATSFGSDRV